MTINVCRPNQVRLYNFVGRRDGNGQQHSRHGVQPAGPVHQEQLQQAATETTRSSSYCCKYFNSRLWDLKLHCESKTASFYFCNNFDKSFYTAVIVGVHIGLPQYTWNKMTSESSISFEGCLYTAQWNAAIIHVLWPTSVLSRKLKSGHYRLEHLNGTSLYPKVWKCMEQQCSAIVNALWNVSAVCHWANPHLLAFSRQNASLTKLLADCRPARLPFKRQSLATTFGHVILFDNFTSPIPYSLPHHAASGRLY